MDTSRTSSMTLRSPRSPPAPYYEKIISIDGDEIVINDQTIDKIYPDFFGHDYRIDNEYDLKHYADDDDDDLINNTYVYWFVKKNKTPGTNSMGNRTIMQFLKVPDAAEHYSLTDKKNMYKQIIFIIGKDNKLISQPGDEILNHTIYFHLKNTPIHKNSIWYKHKAPIMNRVFGPLKSLTRSRRPSTVAVATGGKSRRRRGNRTRRLRKSRNVSK